MGGHQGGEAGGADQRDQDAEDVGGGVRIEVAGGLVGEQQARAVGHRARDGDALLLAARELGRPVQEALPQAEEAQELARPLAGLALRQPADELRHHHVLQGREFRQEVVELVDEAHLLAPQAGALGIPHRGRRTAADIDLAAVGALQQAGEVQQGALAGPRGRHQGDELARPDREIRLAQDFEGAGLAGPWV